MVHRRKGKSEAFRCDAIRSDREEVKKKPSSKLLPTESALYASITGTKGGKKRRGPETLRKGWV